MFEDDISRRRVLRASGTLAASGAISSLAGCSGPGPLGSGAEKYRNVLYDPRIIDRDHYFAGYFDVSGIFEHRQEFNRDFFESLRSLDDPIPGLRFEEMGDLVTPGLYVSGSRVVTGEYESDDIVTAVREADYSRAEDYEGYEIYERDGGAVGVSDADIIRSRPAGSQSGTAMVKFVIDAKTGDVSRYHKVNSDFEELSGTLGAGHMTILGTTEPTEETDAEAGQFRNNVGYGSKYDVNGEETDLQVVFVFLDERDVVVRDIETWTDNSSAFERAYDISVDENGRTATVSATMDTRDVEGRLFF